MATYQSPARIDRDRRVERVKEIRRPYFWRLLFSLAFALYLLGDITIELLSRPDGVNSSFGIWLIAKFMLELVAIDHCLTAVARFYRIICRTPIDFNHGETYDEVVKNLRHERYEYLAIFDTDGVKLTETTEYDDCHVGSSERMMAYLRKCQVAIILHNHPEQDACFSRTDWYCRMKRPYITEVIVTRLAVYTICPSEHEVHKLDVYGTYCKAERYATDCGYDVVYSDMLCSLVVAQTYGFRLTCETEDDELLELWRRAGKEAKELVLYLKTTDCC